MSEDTRIEAVSETLFLPALLARAREPQRPDPMHGRRGRGRADAASSTSASRHSDKQLFRRLAAGQACRARCSRACRCGSASTTAYVARVPHARARRRRREPRAAASTTAADASTTVAVRWFDLDLPEVIALRRRFLRETDRMRFIAASVLDFAWLDELPSRARAQVPLRRRGPLHVPAARGRPLARHNARASGSPAAELVAEVASSQRGPHAATSRLGRGKFRRQFGLSENVVYTFGMDDSSRTWRAGRRASSFSASGRTSTRTSPSSGWYRWFARWPMLRSIQWTVHYRLGIPDALRSAT